jgi:hypothetical protein
MQGLLLYQFTNRTADLMADPWRKVAHALTYIAGPAVDEWKRRQVRWITQVLVPTPPHADVWDEFQANFEQDWQDVNAQTNAATQLQRLRMQGQDIDTYISTFDTLATKAQYPKDNEAVLNIFKNGLSFELRKEITLSDTRTHNWDDLVTLARNKQSKLTELAPHRPQRGWFRGRGGRPHSNRPFFLTPSNRPGGQQQYRTPSHHPDAMQVDAARGVSEADAQKLRQEGRCFLCKKQGHIKRNCPIQKKQQQGGQRIAKIAEVGEETRNTSPPNTSQTLTTDQVFDFLRSCDAETYGTLQKRWEEAEGGEQGFPQA